MLGDTDNILVVARAMIEAAGRRFTNLRYHN